MTHDSMPFGGEAVTVMEWANAKGSAARRRRLEEQRRDEEQQERRRGEQRLRAWSGAPVSANMTTLVASSRRLTGALR